MPQVIAAAVVVFNAVATWYAGLSVIGALVVRTIVTFGIAVVAGKLMAPNNPNGSNSTDTGIRVQLPPATDNRLPVVYGSAYIGGAITDAFMASTDSKTNNVMWYCVALSEKTGNIRSTSTASVSTIGKIYWAQNEVHFKSDGVTIDYTQDNTGGQDTNLRDLVEIYLFNNGGANPTLPTVNVAGTPAAPTAQAYQVWAGGGVWTANNRMDGTVFALIKVNYNRDKNSTGLPDVRFQVQNTMNNPGDVFYDYATNLRYGAGIAAAEMDTTSLNDLVAWSNESVTYNSSLTMARYRINGVIRTQETVLGNLERITTACGSWLTYDIGSGLWGVVINYGDAEVVDLNFSDEDIIGGIGLSGTALDQLYNSVEVTFPHADLRDQPDVRLEELAAEDRNPNEPDNRLNLQIELTNEPVQAQILGDLELRSNRLEQMVTFNTDYSKIQTEAGDIIAIYNDAYGWNTAGGYPEGKDFRVLRVVETEGAEGQLVVQITAKEYLDVPNPNPLTRPAVNTDTGIVGDSVFGTPAAPTYVQNNNTAKPTITLKGVIPTGAFSAVTFLEFYATSDVITTPDSARKYFLVGASNTVLGADNGLIVNSIGTPIVQGNTIVLENVTLPAGTYLFKVRCGNIKSRGTFSTTSTELNWAPLATPDALNASTRVQTSCGNIVGMNSHMGSVISGGDIDFGSVNGFGNGTAGGGNTSAATNNLLAVVGPVFTSLTNAAPQTVYSVDGIYGNANNWIATETFSTGRSFGAAYSNNRFVTSITQFDSTGNSIPGTPATLLVDYTPDLSTQCPHGVQFTLVNDQVAGVAASGNTVVAVGVGYSHTMTNLNLVDLYTQPNWVTGTTNIVGQDVVKASTRWVAVGENASGNLGVVYSSTGTSWTDASIAVAGRFFSVAKGTISSTEYVVAGGGATNFSSGNLAYYSTDVGSTWTAMTGLGSNDYILGIAFGNSRFVAVGFNTSTGNGNIWTSTTGTSWTAVTGLGTIPSLSAVDYSTNQNKFYAGGSYKATNGINLLSSNSTGTTWAADPDTTSKMDIYNIACFR